MPAKKAPDIVEPKLDHKSVSGMLGLLKYHAKKENSARQDESKQALAIYSALSDTAARQSFLASFEDAGKGKVPGSLKFALEFRQSVSSTKKTKLGSTEDYYTRPVYMRRSPAQESSYNTMNAMLCMPTHVKTLIHRLEKISYMSQASDLAD
jgi:hypothetical protein